MYGPIKNILYVFMLDKVLQINLFSHFVVVMYVTSLPDTERQTCSSGVQKIRVQIIN